MKFIFRFNEMIICKNIQHTKKQEEYDEIIKTINLQLHFVLSKYKNLIESYYQNNKWDKYKKIANDYELVFTSCYGIESVSKYNSISRSFFKLWEILMDFDMFKSKEHIKAAFIADGPGGFIEAFCKYRDEHTKVKKDSVYGITLLSKDPSVPNWKISKAMKNKYNIELLPGEDGTGSIYNLENIKNFVQTIGSNSCEFVTADGGFDFSKDFNNQETQSFHLILCEIFIALQLQKKGGMFVLKVFDICYEETIAICYLLYMLYDNVYITKPLSSRPANSEKYIICTGYKTVKHSMLSIVKNIIKNKEDITDYIKPPIEFVEEILFYNTHCVLLQIINIEKTIHCINNKKLILKKVVEEQVKFATKYCTKYQI